MRAFFFAVALALLTPAPVALAQTSAAPPVAAAKTFASSSDVTALIAKAKAERKEDRPLVAEPILLLAPYRANLEYRPALAPASVHENEAEVMYVIEGSGTIVTGGKLVDEKRVNPTNLTGTSIASGTAQPIAKGDFLIVPEGTPHQINPIGGAIVLMTLHVPRGSAAR